GRGEQVLRLHDRAAVPERRPRGPVSGGRVELVVARSRVRDVPRVLAGGWVVVVARDPGAREEGRHAPGLTAHGAAPPEIDAVEVPGPVVTEQAVEVRQAQELRRRPDPERIEGIL